MDVRYPGLSLRTGEAAASTVRKTCSSPLFPSIAVNRSAAQRCITPPYTRRYVTDAFRRLGSPTTGPALSFQYGTQQTASNTAACTAMAPVARALS